MKKLVISSGNWTANGNFSGYDAAQGRVHIYAAQMKGLGYDKDATVSMPFYATGEEKEFNQLGEDGNPTGETFKRLQATSTFKDRKSLVEALAVPAILDLEVRQFVKASATSAGLTEAEVEALVNAGI